MAAGKYKMECWGAQGGSGSDGKGGYGGYTRGDIVLNTQRIIYLYVGGVGISGNISYGGWNGGGGGNHRGSGGGGGGGATDVRLVNGAWNDIQSLKSRIMIAAGGGGCGRYRNGGSGGGLQGGYGSGSANQGAPGTQTSGAGFGVGGNKTTSTNYGNGGGGSGYYGGFHGKANDYYATGGGGSSFISGHDGCDAISAASMSSNIIHTGQSIHYSGLYFTNTVMIDGAGYQWTTAKGSYVGMPNLAGTGTKTGNTGYGQIKITPVN